MPAGRESGLGYVGPTFDEAVAIMTFVLPLFFVLRMLLRSCFAGTALPSVAVAEDAGDFAALMARFRAADPDRVGVDADTLRSIVGPLGAQYLERTLHELRLTGERVPHPAPEGVTDSSNAIFCPLDAQSLDDISPAKFL